MFTRQEIRDYTKQEICRKLERASAITLSGVETMFLSDRLEPWLELARPLSHNMDTRIFYWPEMAI